MIFLGIDPGKSGALALVDGGGGVVDYVKLNETAHDVSDWLRAHAGTITAAQIERVHAMPRQGVSSSFKFGESFGFCLGLLVCHRIPFEHVTPAKWQRALGCRTGGDKRISKARAQELWPSIKITHAIADALLIAEHTRRIHNARSR